MCALVASAALAQDAENGIIYKGFVFTPGADIESIYDSNVSLQPNDEISDLSFYTKFGLGVSNQAEKVRMNANLWGALERYMDETDENHEDWGESLKFKMFDKDTVQVIVRESYEDIQSLDYSTGTIEPRRVTDAGFSGARQFTDKLDGDIGYSYQNTVYESPLNFDWYENSVNANALHDFTAKSRIGVLLDSGTQVSDGNREDGKYVTAMFGFNTRNTDKINLESGIGYMTHRSDNDISTLAYKLTGSWKTTEKVSLNANINSGIEPASQDPNNFNETVRGSLGATWNIVKEWSASLTGMYAQNDFTELIDRDGVLEKKKDDTYTGTFRVTYQPPVKALKIYFEQKYEDKDSTFDSNDYKQYMTKLGLSLVY